MKFSKDLSQDGGSGVVSSMPESLPGLCLLGGSFVQVPICSQLAWAPLMGLNSVNAGLWGWAELFSNQGVHFND